MMIKHTWVLVFSFLLLAEQYVYSQPLQIEKTAEWSQQGYYILNPVFAHAKNELAFVRRWSGKDSSIDAQKTFLQGAAFNFLLKNSIQARQYDPVVSVFDYQSQKLSLIDYGWSPAFSTNDNRLAYAFQKAPLKRTDELYAEAYKGNSIKVFDTRTTKIREVAKPLNNYLLDPFFVDSLKLVYKAGDRVNGPYGAAVSLNEVDLATQKTVLIQQPAIKYRLYVLIGEPSIIQNKLAYIVYSPADSGTGIANEYEHLLLSGTDTLQNFGIRKFTNLNYKFAATSNQMLLFLDDEHFMAEDTNFVATYKNDRLLQKRPLPANYFKGYLSPNGKYLFYITQDMEAYLVNVQDMKQIKVAIAPKHLHTVAWSAEGDKIGLVQEHETFSGTDKLTIYSIR